jgi:hypothetical protein
MMVAHALCVPMVMKLQQIAAAQTLLVDFDVDVIIERHFLALR